MASGRILPLDSLRGIAALGVTMFWHYGHFGGARPFQGPVADWLYGYGLMLVDFFFVLSGFVISHVYLEKVAERRVRPSEFFVLRFSRLYPLHLATLLIVAGLQAGRSSAGLDAFVYEANDLFHFVLNLGFVQYGVIRTEYSFNGPSWSLTIEEISYVAFFLALFFFARGYRAAFGALLALGVTINLAGWDVHFLNLDVARGLVGFFAGCLAYQLHRVARYRGRSGLLAIGSALVLVSVVLYYTRAPYPLVARTLLTHSLLIFPALVLVILNTSPLAALFSLRPLAYLGEISYSMYMIHFPLQIVLATVNELGGLRLSPGSLSFFLFYAAVTLVLSAASFHLFERRAQAAIRRTILGAGAQR